MRIALIVGPDCDKEAEAIRQSLEYFGAQVICYTIGRPKDLVRVLNGQALLPQIEHLILSFHGVEGCLLMPELHHSIYEEVEPKINFGPEEIAKYACFAGQILLNTACNSGTNKFAQVFLQKGIKTYIAPQEYPEGDAVLFFVIRFYYELLAKHQTLKNAFDIAAKSDSETEQFTWYD